MQIAIGTAFTATAGTADVATLANTIHFTAEGAGFMNATSPVMNRGVKYASKVMSGAAKALIYDRIMYNSLRSWYLMLCSLEILEP